MLLSLGLLIILIIIVAYLLNGMLFNDFAERHYDLSKKYFPTFMIWPKTREKYILIYKITIVILLLTLVGFFAYFLIQMVNVE